MELAYDILCCSPALYIPSALPLDWVLHGNTKMPADVPGHAIKHVSTCLAA